MSLVFALLFSLFESDNYYNSDIIIAFGRYNHGDMFPFDGPGFVLAHAYYPYELGSYGGVVVDSVNRNTAFELGLLKNFLHFFAN